MTIVVCAGTDILPDPFADSVFLKIVTANELATLPGKYFVSLKAPLLYLPVSVLFPYLVRTVTTTISLFIKGFRQPIRHTNITLVT